MEARSHVTLQVVFSAEHLVAVGTSESLDAEMDLVKVVPHVVERFEHLFALCARVFCAALGG